MIAVIEIVPMTVPATIPPMAAPESEELEGDIYSQPEWSSMIKCYRRIRSRTHSRANRRIHGRLCFSNSRV